MQSATFRTWLAERGCHFHQHERGHGHVTVVVEREGRTATLPLVGSHEALRPEVTRQICDQLGLDWSELPGPQGRT